jgi:hypothetical protein
MVVFSAGGDAVRPSPQRSADRKTGARGIPRRGDGRLAGQEPQRRWGWWLPTPSEQDQQAHQSNDVLAHWFLCRAHTNASVMRPAPSARRLRALIEVLGFEGLGAQVRFAEEIGVGRKRLNNVLVGSPLSQKLAQKIIGRYPQVSMDFLLLGRSGGNLDQKLERRLSDYQRRTGISVFTSPA